MADLAHLDRAATAHDLPTMLRRFDLLDAADRRAQTYSGGMKRRLDLAMPLLARPRLIFLDQPTAGLDPRSRRALWSVVREQVAETAVAFALTWLTVGMGLATRRPTMAGEDDEDQMSDEPAAS